MINNYFNLIFVFLVLYDCIYISFCNNIKTFRDSSTDYNDNIPILNITLDNRRLNYSKRQQFATDLAAVRNLQPLKSGYSVHYWRPQKVGSSTILALLLSYSYRYNFLPKRKAGANSLCRQIAQCAKANPKSYKNSSIAASVDLEKYIQQTIPGSASNKRPIGYQLMEDIKLSISIPYKISLAHEICNIHEQIIETSLSCAFKKSKSKQVTDNIITVKEIFMVRDPIDRSISVYYFWGELFKMVRGSKLGKKSSQSSSGKHRKQQQYIQKKNHKTTPQHQRQDSNNEGGAIVTTTRQLSRSKSEHQQQHSRKVPRNKLDGSNSHDVPFHSHSETDMRDSKGHNTVGQSKKEVQLQSSHSEIIPGQFFSYHGNENTAPTMDYAMSFGKGPIYKRGMPGPSFTWTLFSNTVQGTLDALLLDQQSQPQLQEYLSSTKTLHNKNRNIVTIVLERLDESLVVLANEFNWSLADVVVIKQRKALSSHPKAKDWPPPAINALRQYLETNGEYAVYNASIEVLDKNIKKLNKAGVDVDKEVLKLQALRKRVSKICLDDAYLEIYRNFLSKKQKLPQHSSNNKLRDVEEKYSENNHIFSFNREMLLSFDVCASCEAHAILYSIETSSSIATTTTIESASTLSMLDSNQRKDNDVHFKKCPKF